MQNLSYNNFCLAKQKLLMAGPELPSNFEVTYYIFHLIDYLSK